MGCLVISTVNALKSFILHYSKIPKLVVWEVQTSDIMHMFVLNRIYELLEREDKSHANPNDYLIAAYYLILRESNKLPKEFIKDLAVYLQIIDAGLFWARMIAEHYSE